MRDGVERLLTRWLGAGLVDLDTVERIRAFEARGQKPGRVRWWAALVVALGGLLVAAGILLFVAAHWNRLAPSERFAVVVASTAVLHAAAAAVGSRFPALATTLHAVGTVAAGAGIFLSAQIFNLQAHWLDGLLLWAIAACVGTLLLGDWPQAGLAAVLVPFWVWLRWFERYDNAAWHVGPVIVWPLAIAFAYLSSAAPVARRSASHVLTRPGARRGHAGRRQRAGKRAGTLLVGVRRPVCWRSYCGTAAKPVALALPGAALPPRSPPHAAYGGASRRAVDCALGGVREERRTPASPASR
jgi:hypothetical protein